MSLKPAKKMLRDETDSLVPWADCVSPDEASVGKDLRHQVWEMVNDAELARLEFLED